MLLTFLDLRRCEGSDISEPAMLLSRRRPRAFWKSDDLIGL
jgi:hypothetical protein